jgi:transcriptional regulator with PAS, ATPase and Fis domain
MRSVPALRVPPEPLVAHGFIVGPDGPLSRVLEMVRRIARSQTSVLIQGETGTGKTCLARQIHNLSPRRDRPFLTINSAALSVNVIESELFGHVRGAFTGADRDRTGKLAAVENGTLLLDDIDALPLELQAKLLQAIEERVFEPVGSNQQQPMRARLIATSNRPLLQEAQAGRFRTDLYYRLNVLEFTVPPLRQNRELLPELAQRFVQDCAQRDEKPVQDLKPAALQALLNHDWPGNVRELRNVIERAVALCTGAQIDLEDLPEPLQAISPAPLAQASVEEQAAGVTLAARKQITEKQAIREVLQRNRNNKLRTAADLGISRMTLYKKLHLYGLMVPTFGNEGMAGS